MSAPGRKSIYGGCFPIVWSLERVFTDMPHVPFRDGVWPKFLHGNARRCSSSASSDGQASAGSGDEENRCRLH
jgi:hypothetical protein